jgi:hypothetical protein
MDTQQCVLCIVAIHNSLRIIWNAYLHVKFPIFFSDFNQIWVVSTNSNKSLQYKISWKSARWELSWTRGETDGRRHKQTHMIELIGTFANISKSAPKNCTFFPCSVLKVFCMISGQTAVIPGNIINWLTFRHFLCKKQNALYADPARPSLT